jgi:hypothetical protein
MTNYAALKKAATDTATITGGCLDYVIANAGYVSQFDAYDGIEVLYVSCLTSLPILPFASKD